MTLHPHTVTLDKGPYALQSGHVTKKLRKLRIRRSNISSQNKHQVTKPQPSPKHVGSLFLLAAMFPKDGVDLLLHEGPGHL